MHACYIITCPLKNVACLPCCHQPALLLLACHVTAACHVAAGLPLHHRPCLYIASLSLRCQPASTPPARHYSSSLSFHNFHRCSLLIILLSSLSTVCLELLLFFLYNWTYSSPLKINFFTSSKCAVEVCDSLCCLPTSCFNLTCF